MLRSIDTLIGLALAMLVASMAVTVLTQIWTTVFNTRGVHLREGLAGLLRQLNPQLSGEIAQAVSDHLLRHPMVADAGRLGSLVHREEFTRLLLELAGGEGPRTLPEIIRRALSDTLRANGIEDPVAALGRIRDLALSLELSTPSLAAGARHDLAILHAASSDFVAKVNGWFDQTIDRISVRFTVTTHKIALANALLVACAIQLDTVALVNRLTADSSLRATLVGQAAAHNQIPAATLPEIESLAGQKLFPVATSASDWLARWTGAKVPGVLLSVLLLSLGGPFWFETLKNLLRLRSAISAKDDEQRQSRQTSNGTVLTSPSRIC